MESGNIAALVIVLVFIGLMTGLAFLILRIANNKTQSRIEALPPRERELHDAQEEYSASLKAAAKIVKAEEKLQNARIKEAQKLLDTAKNYGTQKLGSYGSITLTETTLFTSQGAHKLTPDITATVETAGNLAIKSRSTVTRIATGGLLFGGAGAIVGGVAKKNKTIDKRELYLVIEGKDFSELVTCNADDGAKVRQLAVAIRQAGLNAENVRLHQSAAIKQASENMAQVRNDAASLLDAKHKFDVVKTNTARLDAAKKAIESKTQDSEKS